MKKIFKLLPVLFMSLFVASCDEYDAGSDFVQDLDLVAFTFNNHNLMVEESTTHYDFKVHATKVSNVDRVINITRTYNVTGNDERFISVPTTVVIPAGELETTARFFVDFSTLEYSYIDEEGAALPLPTMTLSIAEEGNEGIKVIDNKKTMSIVLTKVCSYETVKLELEFDQYPEETSWAIFEASNTTTPVLAKGSDEAYAGATEASEDLCLAPGSYFLVLYDAYNDGFCCSYGNGSYNLSRNGVVLASGSGTFTSFLAIPFTLD